MIKANIKEAVRSLASSKQRTILALLGIVIGIGSVIALVSTGTIVQRESMKQFMEMGTDVLKVQKDMRRGEQNTGFRLDDVTDLEYYIEGISSAAPYASAHGVLRVEGQRFNVAAIGVTQSFIDINQMRVAEGRFISDLDYLMYQAVIGGGLANNLRQEGMEQLVGQQIFFEDRMFTVVGELEPVAFGPMRPWESNEGLMIPISTALRMSESSSIREVMVVKDSNLTHDMAQERMQDYFENLSRPESVTVRSAEQIIEHMEKQMQMFTLLLGAIGSISLIVGGVGVMNVMLVSVAERKKEIGIRRALGAQKKDIQSQFLMESVILSLLGGFLGIIIGIAVSFGISKFSGWEFMIVYGAVFIGVGVSAAVGIFFGFYPARQAANLIPIQALRSD
ncbi:ABC transporter permease [Desulfonatronovibrio magnus]|uniref:ABC transporter permease n=1 Tax=Desulfonatronovibrio magnus TaxID=698827 RepID=UPI0005EBA9AB|nr:ABC transporter permease [Desulfonatronovibrio magnus]